MFVPRFSEWVLVYLLLTSETLQLPCLAVKCSIAVRISLSPFLSSKGWEAPHARAVKKALTLLTVP